MKFSEIPYKRPDLKEEMDKIDALTQKFLDASSAEEQYQVMKEFDNQTKHSAAMYSVASIRYTINTKDEFYAKEQEFYDENMPYFEEKAQQFENVILESKFRPELEQKLGKLLFKSLELNKKCFSPVIIEDLQEENKLTSEYQKLYGSAVIEFDGKKMPLPMLGVYKESPDRAVRKAAYEADANFFDSNRQQFDEIFDALVKVRTKMAKKLGYDSFTQMAYDRMGRNCYGPEEVAKFRDSIAKDAVPAVNEVRELQRKRIGVDKIHLYDNIFTFKNGNVKPHGTPEEILAAGREMYHNLAPETAEFIDLMYDNDLFDVLSRDGKAPGGYCSFIEEYNYPFIFSNFNGTSGDVDVLTHEAGHAFEAYRSSLILKDGLMMEHNATMETCECHSMSMEFLTSDYHHLFFGDDTKKYELSHAEDAFCFIPYGCMVDEFQHVIYEKPDMTPDERNEVWAGLEKKYRPYLDLSDLPFYGRGAGWQRQLHIYESPFYYIDYCMAQTIAFEFWLLWMKDKKEGWRRYLEFVDAAGKKSFEQVVKDAGLYLPYEPDGIKKVSESVLEWIKTHQINE